MKYFMNDILRQNTNVVVFGTCIKSKVRASAQILSLVYEEKQMKKEMSTYQNSILKEKWL